MRQKYPDDAGYDLHSREVGLIWPGREFAASALVPGCVSLDPAPAPDDLPHPPPAETRQGEATPAPPGAPEPLAGDGEPAPGEAASGALSAAEDPLADQAPEPAKPASRARTRTKEKS